MNKKTLAFILPGLLLTSCCTLFTGTKQTITFMAPNGTQIYDAETNVKLAEVQQENMVITKIKKKREDKQLIARKDGYQSVPFTLETSFNISSLWNILFWPGFLIDFGTEKMFKWDNTIIPIEMENKQLSTSSL